MLLRYSKAYSITNIIHTYSLVFVLSPRLKLNLSMALFLALHTFGFVVIEV